MGAYGCRFWEKGIAQGEIAGITKYLDSPIYYKR